MLLSLGTLSCSTGQGDSSIVPGSGAAQTAGVGDRVWEDADGNGIQDVGEPGIEGVRVILSDPSGAPLDEVSSACDGSYSFTGLEQGVYRLAAVTPVGFVPTLCDAGTDDSADSECGAVQISLTSGNFDGTVDFGFRPQSSATIGDLVWHDLDANGVFDEGEPGLEGVEVALRDGGGVELERTTTGVDGSFAFTNLPAGAYVVEVDEATLAPYFMLTTCNPLQDSSPGEPFDSNCNPASVMLPADVEDPTVDFGFRSPHSGRIGDLVWHDVDSDGVQDPGEPGLDGIGLVLLDDFSNRIARTTSRDGGVYGFTGLPAGTYSVEVDLATLPPDFSPSTCDAGPDDSTDSDCAPALVVLDTDDANASHIDFGFQSPFEGAIGDLVWQDEDGDGIQDPGEPGLAGVTLKLTNQLCGVVFTTSSQADGSYRFTGLAAGSYTVAVDPSSVPAPFVATPCDASDDATDNDCGPVSVVLPGGTVDDTVDFGFRSPFAGSVGDTVFFDANRNGLQDDAGGQGLVAGIRVITRNAVGHRSGAPAAATAQGAYRVRGLEPGADYRVAVDRSTVPPDLAPTVSDAGADDTLDSDRSPITISLSAGDEEVEDIDFGFVNRCTLLDFDTDDNGLVLVNGQDISTPPEFGNLVEISATGLNEGAAIFDSTPGGPNAGGPDPDLLVGLGNVLILQGSPGQSVPGVFDQPDDAPEGGKIRFVFTELSELRRIDLVDISAADPIQGARVTLLDEQGRKRVFNVPSGWTGDLVQDGPPGYGTLDLSTLAPQPGVAATATTEQDPTFDPTRVASLEVRLFGAGAVDNLELCR